MSKLYMLIGAPNSGKSTWAKENRKVYKFQIFSMSDYRKRVTGSSYDTSKNKEVFNRIYNDMFQVLNSGGNVCFDSTNMSRKDRRGFLSYLSNLKNKCYVEAIILQTSFPELIRRNNKSNHKLSEEEIWKSLEKFEIPQINEGFSKITWIDDNSSKLDINSLFTMMDGFNQNNSHHKLDLLKHQNKCGKLLYKKLSSHENRELELAALIHDLGKLYTQSWNEERKMCQYIYHENIGSYYSLFIDKNTLDDYFRDVDIHKVAFYINYHMEPSKIENAKPETRDKIINLFGNEWKNLELLSIVDSEARK